MKEINSGMGAESRLERSKGESRQDNSHLEPGNSLISNNNEGESGHETPPGLSDCPPVCILLKPLVSITLQITRRRRAARARRSICSVMLS